MVDARTFLIVYAPCSACIPPEERSNSAKQLDHFSALSAWVVAMNTDAPMNRNDVSALLKLHSKSFFRCVKSWFTRNIHQSQSPHEALQYQAPNVISVGCETVSRWVGIVGVAYAIPRLKCGFLKPS